MDILPIVLGVVVFLALTVVIIIIMSLRKKSKIKAATGGKVTQKNQAHIIREANRRLAKDSHDPAGLIPLGEIYYNNSLWEKAYPIYNDLAKLSAANQNIDTYTCSLRAGVSALKLNHVPEAIVNFSAAYKMNPVTYEVNYYMGSALYKNKNYEKAIPCLKKALVLRPDAEGVYLILGQCFYRLGKMKESLPCFKKALDEDPGNKEALYDMADAMADQGNGDKAIKVFMHLRPDPVYGARSCLQAGLYHAKIKQTEAAIQDLEIGIKHENTPQDIWLELNYRLAQCYFSLNKIPQGLQIAKRIKEKNSNYKDINTLIGRFQELSQNSNLQIYLVSGTNDFVTFCRKIVMSMNKNANVKILDINVGAVYTDILAEIETTKWENTSIYRFFRTTGTTGEIYIRDFHQAMHDKKADHGYCMTAGTFTDEARKFIEGRPIDLIEKVELTKLIKNIG